MSKNWNTLMEMLTKVTNPLMFGWLLGQVLVAVTNGFSLHNAIFSLCITWACFLLAGLLAVTIANKMIEKKRRTLSNPPL